MRIYCLGSLNIDYVYQVPHFVLPGETLASQDLQIYPGGKGLNQSIALAKAGADVMHGGMVGTDGEFLVETLRSTGVCTDFIEVAKEKTGHAIIQVDKGGQNCILLYHGANYCVDKAYADRFLSSANKGDILFLQNEVSGLKDIFETAHSKGMQIAFNPSPFSEDIYNLPLEYVKWWFCNEIEGALLFGNGTPEEIATRFSAKYPDSNLILTLGKDGSLFKNANICVTQPIYPVQAVDTTAAGDTFSGYFMSAVAAGKDIHYALKLASKASSITVSRPGAAVSIPRFDEVII